MDWFGTDYLARLTVPQVEAWYRRLVAVVAARRVHGREPYASICLRHYLDNRDRNDLFRLESRDYLRSFPKVVDALRYHRRVILSQEMARVEGGQIRLAGIVPRLKGIGFPKQAVPGRVQINYSSLVQIGDGLSDIARIQNFGSDVERDLFTSLRGFQLHSRVLLSLFQHGAQVRVDFMSWQTHVHDRYDWNYSEWLTLPNPDYNSKAPDAVRPTDEKLTVYHRNAKRLEDAGRAMPYNLQSDPWMVIDPTLTASALVTL